MLLVFQSSLVFSDVTFIINKQNKHVKGVAAVSKPCDSLGG